MLQAAVVAAIQSAQAAAHAAANGVVVQLDQQNANVRITAHVLSTNFRKSCKFSSSV